MTHEEFLEVYKLTVENLDFLVMIEDLKNNFEDVEDYEIFIQEFDEIDFDTIQAILEAYSGSPKYSIKDLLYCIEIYENDYYTFYKNYNWEDLAKNYQNEGIYGDIPENLQSHIDMEDVFEQIGNDLRADSEFIEVENGLISLED